MSSRWVTYHVKDSMGSVQSRIRAPKDHPVALHPAILRAIIHHGWVVEQWGAPVETGVEIHGIVNWKGLADHMAQAISASVDATEPDAEVRFEYLQSVLDDYRIAQMEESVAQPFGGSGEDGEQGR